MPVVGSSAYNTAGQITSLVRSLLNDAQGNLFTDTLLIPYLNSAYRKVQRAIGNAGGGGFIQDDALLVVAAVAGGMLRCRCRLVMPARRRISCRRICWCR